MNPLAAMYAALLRGELAFFAFQNGEAKAVDFYDAGSLHLHAFPGSFNPVHDGHRVIMRSMREQAAQPHPLMRLPDGEGGSVPVPAGASLCAYELSVRRRDKEPLPLVELEARLAQFEAGDTVLVTNADYFAKKAGAFSRFWQVSFHVGYDTATRLVSDDEKLGVEGIRAAFVVYPRDGLGIDEMPIKPSNMVRAPRVDGRIDGLSSTKIRERLRREAPGGFGMIVGRFQVAELETGHIDLIARVLRQHPHTAIALSSSPAKLTKADPLPFALRAAMIRDKFPDVDVVEMREFETDASWSAALDELVISLAVGPEGPKPVTLYGAADTFVDRYVGAFATEVLVPTPGLRGVARHDNGPVDARDTADFRRGAMWAVQERYPVAIATVDLAILAPLASGDTYVLLGRKPGETRFRVFGGFLDPSDPSVVFGAQREGREESRFDAALGKDTYLLGNAKVPDWRYQGADRIFTTLYAAFWDGEQVPKAGDDIEEARWFLLDDALADAVAPVHRELVQKILAWSGHRLAFHAYHDDPEFDLAPHQLPIEK